MRIIANLAESDTTSTFATIADFEKYPIHSDAVLSVDLIKSDETSVVSSWRVRFRRGILCWTEHATLDPLNGCITFRQVEGDVDEFQGFWKVSANGAGSSVEFFVSFDVGIPTLEHIIEPIAEDALYDNVSSILRGVLGQSAQVVLGEGGSGRTWVG